MKKNNIKIISLCSCIIYAVLIFIGSSIPGSQFPQLPLSNYRLHFGVFFFFGLLLIWWRMYGLKKAPALSFFQASFIGSIYGGLDELHQHFVPNRVVDPYDWVSDTLGSLAGAGFGLFLFFFLKKYGTKKNP
jgi:VanZ family protein